VKCTQTQSKKKGKGRQRSRARDRDTDGQKAAKELGKNVRRIQFE